VTDQWPPLPRAHEELQAARVLAGAGFGAAAVSRSYYAAFCAAEAALLALGETRSCSAALSDSANAAWLSARPSPANGRNAGRPDAVWARTHSRRAGAA